MNSDILEAKYLESESSMAESEFRQRKLEEEFNLVNKNTVIEQFMKFSKESIDDILNSSCSSSQSLQQLKDSQPFDHSSNTKGGKQIFSFHQSWGQLKKDLDQQPTGDFVEKTEMQNKLKSPKLNEVTSSCPAEMLKNYSNVFAQMTKQIIGDVETESENEMGSTMKRTSARAREALSEIQTKKGTNEAKYKFDNIMNDSSEYRNREDLNKAFDDFYKRHNIRHSSDKENHLQLNQITTIEEKIDEENMISNASTNRINCQQPSGQKPQLNLFRQNLKSPSRSPNRYLNTYTQDNLKEPNSGTKNFSNFMLANSNSNQTLSNQKTKPIVQYLYPLNNEQLDLNFEQFYSGRTLGNSLRIFNSHQFQNFKLQVKLDHTQQYYDTNIVNQKHQVDIKDEIKLQNSENQYQCWFIEDPKSKELRKHIEVEILANSEIELVVVLVAPHQNESQMKNLVSYMYIQSESQTLNVLLRGQLFNPCLVCQMDSRTPKEQERIIKFQMKEDKQDHQLVFKNMNDLDSQLPPMLFHLALIDIDSYQSHFVQNLNTRIDYKVGRVQLKNGVEVKLNQNQLQLDTNSQEEMINISFKRVGRVNSQNCMTILVVKLDESDLIYFFLIDVVNI